ncbi:MAG: dTDP-4-dehydrorhamnose reductase [Nitrospira sp.]|nr:dTDP-4-dehydrorhamnose reductase [Nitrospira sp.]
MSSVLVRKKMLTILLTGKNGQVGFELQRALAPLGEGYAVDQEDCDLATEASVRALLRHVRPDVIVNPAAYTAVDRAESEPHAAHAVNAVAPGVIGEEANKLGALVIHYSTDYVFDGSKPGFYTEEDETKPLNVYGQSKRAGELALQEATARHLILRTSWVVGAHGTNFAKTILRLAAERDMLHVVADQWGAPTSAALLADCTAHLIREWQYRRDGQFPYGLYHLVAAGETNWCDYARFVVAEALVAGRPLKLSPDAIKAIPSSDYPMAAARPANSRLDTSKFRNTFGLALPDWRDGVRHVLRQLWDRL